MLAVVAATLVLGFQTSTSLEGTKWNVVALDKKPISAPVVAPWIRFDKQGRFAAFTGVNQLGGTYTLTGDKITFKPGPMTMMGGTPSAMKVEQAFLDAISEADALTQKDKELILSSKSKERLKLKKTRA